MSPIDIGGRTYQFLQRHQPSERNSVRIYMDESSFVRVGPPDIIETNLRTHKRLESAGFPVPKILSEGNIGSEKYFIEESLGETILRLQFADEVRESGQISNQSFEAFLKVVEMFLTAQAKTIGQRDEVAFLDGMHVARLCEELPSHASKIRTRAEESLESLSEFPFALSHGDFSPSNLFPKGIIDFEDSLSAPFGYDAVCALTTCEWFPESGELEFPINAYHYTDEQKEEYLTMCDEIAKKNGFPTISPKLQDFDFFRAVWLTEGMGEWPKAQAQRYERFINQYLK